MYLFPPVSPLKANFISKGFFLSIPKIHAYSVVLPNVDPGNEDVYTQALKQGIAHAKGTALPGEKGTVFLFAHSSGAPWEITHENTLFLRLPELVRNDMVLLDYKGKRYKYIVIDKKEVWPQDVQYLKYTKNNVLILQTCTPLGTSLKRLLVFAQLQK
jgi:LPXTG-site transpeptidase (sortase) family protein